MNNKELDVTVDAELAFTFDLEEKILNHGFTFVGVIDNPAFVYSIGLTGRHWPEVLLVGNIRPAYVEQILTDLINSWKEKGMVVMGDNPDMIQFTDGTSRPLRVVAVDRTVAIDRYVCQATRFYPEDEINVVQVLWPDLDGNFPDDADYNTRMAQPIVGK